MKRVAALTLSALLLLLVPACGHSGPDKAACKRAMQKQFDYGMKHPDAPAGKRPAQCKGVSDKDLQRFTSEILSRYVNGTS